jgi:CubicO group peptidase (beta-lactamase class C family)
MRIIRTTLFVFLVATLLHTALFAQTHPISKFPDAAATDPNALGWMKGFPPPPAKTVKISNYSNYFFPRTRWSFSHWRELYPTKNVFRGTGPVAPIESALINLDELSFKDTIGNELTWRISLDMTYTDGILVLHKGKIVYEKYFGALSFEKPHIAFSVTKSFIGTLAAMYIAEGKLDPAATVSQYVPELQETGFGDATVQQLLDMTTGVQFSEAYGDPRADITRYSDSGSPMTACPGYKGAKTYYEYLTTLKKAGPHGEAFGYKTANTEVLSWILKRVSGQSLADLLSETVWSKIGAEQDAFFAVDTVGTEHTGGGLNTSLRDLARFGEMMRLNGRYNGRQIVPAAAIEDICRGGDKEKFARAKYSAYQGWSYHNMWWITHNEHGAYMALGMHGQNIYIDPKAQMVIVRYASNPIAGSSAINTVTVPAYMAVAKYLLR